MHDAEFFATRESGTGIRMTGHDCSYPKACVQEHKEKRNSNLHTKMAT